MTTYIDTSILVKLYLNEPGTDNAFEILAKSTPPVVSVLGAVELRAALRRALKAHRLTRDRYHDVLKMADQDAAHLSVTEIDSAVLSKSLEVIDIYGLKSLDAIHLASAIHAHCKAFATSDQELKKAAKGEGMKVLAA